MSKEVLAELIDAYADAKASKNKVLIATMIKQLEMALDEVFGATEAPASDGSRSVDITPEY